MLLWIELEKGHGFSYEKELDHGHGNDSGCTSIWLHFHGYKIPQTKPEFQPGIITSG